MSEFPLSPLGTLISSPIADGPHTTPDFLSEGIPFLSVDGIQDGELVFDKCRFISAEDHDEFSKKAKPQKGDILMGKAASTGKIALVRTDSEFSIWSPLAIIRSNSSIISDFLAFALKSIPAQIQIDNLCSYNTQKNIAMSDIPRIRIPLPPLETQQRIADYLDRETSEIDAAVADLDRYVELLELRARTLIKQQLSGDHPQVKMGLLADAIIGITYSPNDVVEEGGTKVYRSGNVQDSRINRQNMLAVNVEIPPHLRFQEDDILMCSRNGSANLVGKNAIVGPEDLGHTWGAFMTVIRSDLNRYLFWFFRSPQFDAYRGLFSTSTINQLTTGILNRIPVPLPTRGRRDEIVKALELEVEEIDALIAESIKLRDLLLRRRSVLITEVVTGRKQV